MVLLLVLISFALLVAALVTTRTSWAWGSVTASAVAAGLLIADWLGRRGDPDATPDDATPHDGAASASLEQGAYPEQGTPAQRADTGSDRPGSPAGSTVGLGPEVDPAEEKADIGDAIRIADLDDEVRVIDERPRYHLHGCQWVGARSTLTLAVREARELGFTPCSQCRPDATLAARHRNRPT